MPESAWYIPNGGRTITDPLAIGHSPFWKELNKRSSPVSLATVIEQFSGEQ